VLVFPIDPDRPLRKKKRGADRVPLSTPLQSISLRGDIRLLTVAPPGAGKEPWSLVGSGDVERHDSPSGSPDSPTIREAVCRFPLLGRIPLEVLHERDAGVWP